MPDVLPAVPPSPAPRAPTQDVCAPGPVLRNSSGSVTRSPDCDQGGSFSRTRRSPGLWRHSARPRRVSIPIAYPPWGFRSPFQPAAWTGEGNPFYEYMPWFDDLISQFPAGRHWLIGRPHLAGGPLQPRDILANLLWGDPGGSRWPGRGASRNLLLYSGIPEWLPVAGASGCARTVPYPHPGPLRGLWQVIVQSQPRQTESTTASPGQLLGGAISAHQGFRILAVFRGTRFRSMASLQWTRNAGSGEQPTCTSHLPNKGWF